MKTIALVSILAISGCGISYIVKTYDATTSRSDLDYQGAPYRIFDRKDLGKVMITPSVGSAALHGAAKGATFGGVDIDNDEPRYAAVAKAYLDKSREPGACEISKGRLLASPQWEFEYTCKSVAGDPAASAPVADRKDAISTGSLTCHKPYELARDCSSWTGPNRKATVGGVPVLLAGSADGRIILVQPGGPTKWKGEEAKAATDASLQAMVHELTSRGAGVRKVRPVMQFGVVTGYVFELERDGYSDLAGAPDAPVTSSSH